MLLDLDMKFLEDLEMSRSINKILWVAESQVRFKIVSSRKSRYLKNVIAALKDYDGVIYGNK